MERRGAQIIFAGVVARMSQQQRVDSPASSPAQVCKKTEAAAKATELAGMRAFKEQLDAQIADNQVARGGACLHVEKESPRRTFVLDENKLAWALKPWSLCPCRPAAAWCA